MTHFIYKTFGSLILFTSALNSSYAPMPALTTSSRPVTQKKAFNQVKPVLEVKGGYFFFTDSKMHKIYNEGGWDVQVSASYSLLSWLQMYSSVEYLEKRGRSLNDHQKTELWEIPLSLGLKPVLKIGKKMQAYFTLGPRYFFVHVRNHSSFVDRRMSGNGLGGFMNTGFNFFPTRHCIIDVFGEYSFKEMHFHAKKQTVYGESAQVGGLAFGVGLGYVF